MKCENCGLVTFKSRAAAALADAVEGMIRRGQIDSRSPAGDALLDYRDEHPDKKALAETYKQDSAELLKELIRRYKAQLDAGPNSVQAYNIHRRIRETQQLLHNQEAGGCAARLSSGGLACENPQCSWPNPPAAPLADDIPF